MPKVEELHSKGGILAKSEIKLNRTKRDLTNPNINQKPKKQRVVKKLIRVQLKSNNFDTNTEENYIETTTKRRRRRIKIKKKKRLLHLPEFNKNISSLDEDHLQQATKPRKRIIITKKRLITHTGDHPHVSSTNVNYFANSIDHTRYNTLYEDYDDTSKDNEINDDFDDFDDNDETIVEKPNEDTTESNIIEDTTEHELVTLKESDFFLGNVDDYEEYEDSTDSTTDSIKDTTIADVTTPVPPEDKPPVEVTFSNDINLPVEVTSPKDINLPVEETTLKDINLPLEVTSQNDINLPDEITSQKDVEVTSPNPVKITFSNDVNIPVEVTSPGITTSVDVTSPVQVQTPGAVIKEDVDDDNTKPTFQDIPEYEPYFPELTESLDAPVLILKTTVFSSIEYLTRTVVQSRLRTYTFVVTRVAGTEQIVTSTTEVKPHTKTTVLTEPVTRLTTLTLLDIDATKTINSPISSLTSAGYKPQTETIPDNQIRNYDEARNLATRIMSNGVEVIVMGDKTIPGDKDFKRLLTSGSYKPVTLKPSTLTENMVMLMPQDSSNVDGATTSVYPNQFITKTCLTTFTYLTTFLEGSTTTVSSHEQVVSNIATEERNTGKILPTPAMGVTLTQNPNLSVGLFHTTYTYLNTILDGDQPLVVSSKHTVTNTVTAPDDYMSLLKSTDTLSAVKDTNTYYSTIGLEKTLYEGNKTSVISTKEVVTQVVITESVPPRATSVMTSYIAFDVNDNPDASYTTTDMVKTYYVTYTYLNTITENNKPVVQTNTSISTDVVTEKLYMIPKTSMHIKEQRLENNFQIYTTKSYLTTFTYFTTLLQENNKETPTIVNSRTSVVKNLVSETIDLSLLDKSNLNQIRNAIGKGSKSVIKTISLYNGETFEITAVANEITPTKVLPIEKTKMPESLIKEEKIQIESSAPNIITGSTIVFIDDDPFAQLTPTPVLNKKTTDITNNINTSVVTDKSTKASKTKRSTKSKTKTTTSSINPSKTKKGNLETAKNKPQNTNHKNKDKKHTSESKPASPTTDLLGLGSININSLQAIAPVLNAMAGLITTNLKANRRSDVNVTTTTNKPINNEDTNPAEDIQSRSPIYIPVRGLDDEFEIAESQNIATFDWVDPPSGSHETHLINNGIPISPGDIITTNSDVIVGRPGRIGPRIPSIPLHHVIQENEIPVGMKPPPPPQTQPQLQHSDSWRKKNYEYKPIPVVQFPQNGFVNPPPNYNENINEVAPVYAKNQKNYVPNQNYVPNHHQQNFYNFKENIQTAYTHKYPIYAHNYNQHPELSVKLSDEILTIDRFNNIKPSVIHNEPLILPEVVERSTGQPLLVNIQPSQVAFVNIPYNRTTALIFGGSTEPHRNGQYFDDPSPYPQQEVSNVEINNIAPQVTSVYQPELPNQKQVNGVIKVENQLINNDPSTSENQNIQINIHPTRINTIVHDPNAHPVSYGVVHHGSDFNAHVINHNAPNENQRRPPSDVPNYRKPSHYSGPIYHEKPQPDNFLKRLPDNYLKAPYNKKNTFRSSPKPNYEISEYMSPPAFTKNPYGEKQSKRPVPQQVYHVTPSHERPHTPVNFRPSPPIYEVHVPANMPHPNQVPAHQHSHYVPTNKPHPHHVPANMHDPHHVPTNKPHPHQVPANMQHPLHVPINKPPSNHVPHSNHVPLYSQNQNQIPANPNNYYTVQTPKYTDIITESEMDNHKYDDMENEDGEVIQETNSRPLLPGEVPIEILKASSTTDRTIEHIRISNPGLRETTKPIIADKNYNVNHNQYNNHTTPIYNNRKHIIEDNKKPNHLDQSSLFGIGSHEVVPVNENSIPTRKPVLIFLDDEREESKDQFFNKLNKERPIVTSLPINTFKESTNPTVSLFSTTVRTTTRSTFNNRIRPHVTSLPINTFKENNDHTFKNNKNRERTTSRPLVKRPSVTSLPINTYKEYNTRERPIATSLPLDTFKYKVTSQPVNRFTNYNRPIVTSLPINKYNEFNNRDRPAVTSIAIDKDTNIGTQTEKPFSGIPSKTISSNEIIKKDISPQPTNHPPKIEIDKSSTLNTGEVPVGYDNTSKVIYEMEIMKPPPVVTEKTLEISMEPPNLSQEMVPPPKIKENVLGMVPPPPVPPVSTTTSEPVEIVSPNKKIVDRTRRPFTRRPGYRTTTTTNIPTTTSRKRPVYPSYSSTKPTQKEVINPSPSFKIEPSMEIIIGNPEKPKPSTTTTEQIISSEPTTPSSKPFDDTDLLEMESGIPNRNSMSNIQLSSSSEILTPGVHHAGNEIKIIPDSTKPLPSTIKTVFNETKSKIPIPTRYITHTKTATVTITKTTVIKSLGMTPSTLTILVTKTEKTTIVDTVTEIHTLVKPTSIIETITTTVKQASSLYPDDVYGSQYPSIQVKPTLLPPMIQYNDTFVGTSEENDNLDDFIIKDTDPPPVATNNDNNKNNPLDDNESILVIMTDKNTKNIIKVPTNYETQERDEIISTNPDNNVLLGEILSANANHPEEKSEKILDRCEPECKASRNELCQKIDGHLRCICRPGFARMFPDRPCLPTYTYDLKLSLDRIGKDQLHFYDDLKNPNSTEHFKFMQATGEALDRMVMQSDLRDIFHGVKVHTFEPGAKGIISKFYLQLSENIDTARLEDTLKSYLLNNSFSLGGTDIYTSPLMDLEAKDFDECTQSNFHDCSENAHCFNLKGTYSCSCKEGYADLSENMLYPGRICSAEQVGCEKCNYHGTCFSRGADEVLCECFHWYTGQYCHINLKVLLIALVTLGTLLFGLLLICIILTCIRGKPRTIGVATGINFLPQGNAGRRNTLDRRAMIQDTSSEEDNKSESSRYAKKPKPATKKTSKVSLKVSERGEPPTHTISYDDQKDRSLTVMIPRAKYHPAPPTSPLMNYTSFDARKPSVPTTSNEAKLLSFLDAGPTPNKSEQTRKFSNAQSESIIEEKTNSRKTSGALISAGFEVSATVVNNMGTLGTTCGTEADRSENATLIQKISADLLSSTGTRSQFNTLRKSLIDEDLESNVNDSASNWLDMLPRVMTVSKARSYDETTIPPPMKCLRTDYDSKLSSQNHNDEANTMAERDLGSTFLLPHTHLYKPDRGSDISGFESL